MRSIQAIILAAGEGTRMKSELPKVLHPICGRPMIAYAVDLAAAAGARQPIVILGHGAEAVKDVLPKEAKAVLQPKQLGTGDAVLAAKRSLSREGDVLILYADTPLLRRTTVQRLIEAHFKNAATCTLLTAHLADPSGYGRILRNETGQVVGVVEEADANAAQRAIREINVGPLVCRLQALTAALAAAHPSGSTKELYLTHVIGSLARQEGAKIQVARVEEASEAMGINSRDELARAMAVIRRRIVELHIRNGITIEDPATTYIDHGVSIGVDTVIRPCTVIETGVSIGKRCTIGPFARLRTGTSIGDESRVGNFAELVRTKLGPRVRMQHVSYLGDATVEEDVNIGAGAVTANYDGQAKHPTRIGKGAFIGVDTVLIAPVKIGPGAVTGAGSVVLKAHDVPPKGVVVGVPAHPLDRSGTDGRPATPAAKAPAPRRAPQAKTAKPSLKRPVRVTRKTVKTRAPAKVRRPSPRRKPRPAKRRR